MTSSCFAYDMVIMFVCRTLFARVDTPFTVTRLTTPGTSPVLPVFASWNGVVNGKMPGLLSSKKPQQSQHLPVLLCGVSNYHQQLPAPHSTPDDFPILPPSDAPRQPPITSLPSRRPSSATRSTQTIALLSTTPSSPRITSSPQQVLCTSSTQTPAMFPQISHTAYNDETRYYQLPAESFQAIRKELANGLSLTLAAALGVPCHLQPSNTDSHWQIPRQDEDLLRIKHVAAALSIPALHWRALS